MYTQILFYFRRFYLPLRLKKRQSEPTAALHLFSAVTNLLLVGKWFSCGLFDNIHNIHRQLLFTSPTVLHHPSSQKTATASL